MNNELTMWAIYDHPKDYPDLYVARMFLVSSGNGAPTSNIKTNSDLDVIRSEMRNLGLVQIPRDVNDDPVIIETWL